MSYIPTPEQALTLLKEYNQESFHIKHGQVVAGVLGEIAKVHDADRVAYWQSVGMLHDIDFERYPDQHGVKSQQLLAEKEVDPTIIRATSSHCHGIYVDIPPIHIMEKYLFATDELTGLIGAVALIRPSKSVQDLEVKSIMKKFKTPTFAAGCSRDIITKGAELLGLTLEELMQETLEAMRAIEE